MILLANDPSVVPMLAFSLASHNRGALPPETLVGPSWIK
jgi:hypothetical protein